MEIPNCCPMSHVLWEQNAALHCSTAKAWHSDRLQDIFEILLVLFMTLLILFHVQQYELNIQHVSKLPVFKR